MKYFLDTEFQERPCTIDLISIGVVADDGREYYAVSSEFDLQAVMADEWLMENVFPHLPPDHLWKPRSQIAAELIEFFKADAEPELWGYYSDYDWVVFCWLFGKMCDLPRTLPMHCLDIRQLQRQWGVKSLPRMAKTKNHDALEDARWTRKAYYYILRKNAERAFWGIDDNPPGVDTVVR